MTEPANLEKFSIDDFKTFLDSFDHIFSDCDGVIWTAPHPYPRVGEFFKLMKKLGKTVNFVSNNSIRTNETYKGLFDASAIENGVENLIYPSIAITDYLKSQKFNKQVYCICCKQTIQTFEANGIKCKQGPTVGVEYYGDYVQYTEDDEDIGAVVFDSDYNTNLAKMYKAITYLKRPEVLFISGASDRHVPIKKGLLTLGPGVFTDLVEAESGRQPILMGKPGKSFGEYAMKRAQVQDPSRVLFIGDMIEQDIALGKAVGFHTLLLLTSFTKEEMLSKQDLLPDYYATTLGNIVPLLEKFVK